MRVRSAAGELFRTRGFDATSVRDIAAAAGVSVGTVALAGDKATLFLDDGQAIAAVSERVGHTSAAVTLSSYAKVTSTTRTAGESGTCDVP